MSANRLPSKQHVLAHALRKLLADPTDTEPALAALRLYEADQLKTKRRTQDHMSHVLPVRIGAVRFPTKKAAFHAAQKAGFNATRATFYQRLKHNPTWEEAIAPVDRAKADAHKAAYQRKKDKMAGLLAGMPAPTAYLSHERARDGTPGGFDVVARDSSNNQLARWPWDLSTCPKTRDKTTTINCNTYRIQWETEL